MDWSNKKGKMVLYRAPWESRCVVHADGGDVLDRDEIEAWKQDVCKLLAIPGQERTEDDERRLWARRVRLLGNGWRVVLVDDVVTFQYIGNADGWPEYWKEIRKDVLHEQ